jgi:hypothetical protein
LPSSGFSAPLRDEMESADDGRDKHRRQHENKNYEGGQIRHVHSLSPRFGLVGICSFAIEFDISNCRRVSRHEN